MSARSLPASLADAVARTTDLGAEVAAHYGDPLAEARALVEQAGVADGSAGGAVLVTGPDALAFLQSLVSADLDPLADGEGAHALLLTPQGKLTADFRALRVGADEWWLDADVGVGAVLAGGLARFKIRVDVTISDRSGDFGRLSVRGPAADRVVAEALGVAVPAAPHAHVAAGAVRAVRAEWPDRPGIDVLGPRAALSDARRALLDAGAVPVGSLASEAARVAAGVPRQGHDLDERTIPQEAALDVGAVSFTKGCFLGQELVCRIDTRGHVNRLLRRLRLDAAAPAVPPPGAEVLVEDRVVGVLTSVAPLPGAPTVALGFVRREVEPPAPVSVRWGDGCSAAAWVEARP